MPNDSTHPDVAVFIDFENVYVSVRDKLDANPNFEAIMDRCEDFGRVVIARAYADWYRYPRVTSALYANSIEPIYVPTYYYDRDMGRTGRAIKNSVDMNLCIDAMKTLFTHTNIAKFVLATGDRDFIPLVNSIRQQGKEVIIIGIGGAASSHLAQSADEFIFYETLVGKKPAGDLHKDQPRAKMPEKGREQAEAEAEAEPGPAREPDREPATPPDVYDVLVQAIHLARERGYVCSFGSLKLLMKELMGGEFKENRYKDTSGKPFAKFKDFVLEAERRGKVQVFTSGTVNEVFLPGEDPYKLSQFAQDLKEEPALPVLEVPAPETHAEPRGASVNGRRRRRRTRGGQRGAVSPGPDLAQPEEAIEAEPLEAPGYAALDELLITDQPISDSATDERADETFDTLLDRVEEALAAPPTLIEPVAAEPRLEPEPEPAAPEEVGGPFEESEWNLLRDIVLRFERPAPFNQIHNALREARNSAGITRTNEELRTLIKQAINTGMLERSGKGNHIVYRIAPQATALGEGHDVGETPDQTELIEAAEPAAGQPEFHTPEAAAQAALAGAEPEAAEPIVAPPTVITAEDSAVAEGAPAPKQRSRARRKPAAEAPVEAPAETTPTKARRTRRKKTEPAVQAPAPVVEAPIETTPAETAPAKARRTRRKKTDNAE
jgi:uncharacterized protein (TIGR00288 family)